MKKTSYKIKKVCNDITLKERRSAPRETYHDTDDDMVVKLSSDLQTTVIKNVVINLVCPEIYIGKEQKHG